MPAMGASILCVLLLILLPACTSLTPLRGDQEEQPVQPRFQRVEQLPEGPQAQVLLSDFVRGQRNATTVEWTYDAPYPLVWEACKTVSARFRETGNRPIVKASRIDEKKSRIQHGQVLGQLATGAGRAEWDDEFVIEVSSVSETGTKVVVSRKIVRYDQQGKTDGRAWRALGSNGRIEWWLLTCIQDEIEKRKHLQSVVEPPVVTVRRPPPPAPAPAPREEAIHRVGTVSVETIKVPFIELVKRAQIRSKPTTKSSIVATLEKGCRLEIEGKLREWYRIKLDSGIIGWVHRRLVRQVD